MQQRLLSDRSKPDEVEHQIEDERRLVDYNTSEFTAEVLVGKYRRDDIYIPEYQRDDAWDHSKKSKFIESLLLALPIPFIFLSENDDGRLEVVDGSQRLRAIDDFFNDQFSLVDLDVLDSAIKYRFSELPKSQQRKLENRSIRAIVLSNKTDDTTKFDIFHRLNTYGKMLTDAEIRKGAFPGAFYDLVLSSAQSDVFRKLCPLSDKKVRAGEREELALRFFVYSERYLHFTHDVNRFLNKFIREMNANRHAPIKELAERFSSTMTFIEAFYPYGIRKSRSSNEVPRVRFEAIAVGTYLALSAQPALNPKREDFEWLDSPRFAQLVRTDASNSGPKLRARIEFVRDQLLGLPE